ncbi:kinetochore Sim4 complex subunit Fta4 [Massariosphaeria phaeospora]|uniref:Kinetochore Sim4 complex subunit Fta4 n=1 Tax=Massariosphaeria phaeospora TaxID=100035 RepID=A0A7C8MEI5_9PLEO|nr:kinetochore Sim4 complex subunit Fta4 [Massariosphaeria phaeospora]
MSVRELQDTVGAQKRQFIQQQKHILSRGIAPSHKLVTIATDAGIPVVVLKGALDKVNRDLKRHSRQVYSRQMSEHVVDQIDILYWEVGGRNLEVDNETTADSDGGRVGPYQGDDLTQDEQSAKLPATWDTSGDPHPAPDDEDVTRDDYIAAVTHLQDLSARRLTLQQKLSTHRTLLSLLEPYCQPKENIQPNLVWKESPLAPELLKTRTLALRVAGRANERFGDVQVPSTTDEDELITGADHGKAKLDKILSTW